MLLQYWIHIENLFSSRIVRESFVMNLLPLKPCFLLFRPTNETRSSWGRSKTPWSLGYNYELFFTKSRTLSSLSLLTLKTKPGRKTRKRWLGSCGSHNQAPKKRVKWRVRERKKDHFLIDLLEWQKCPRRNKWWKPRLPWKDLILFHDHFEGAALPGHSTCQ